MPRSKISESDENLDLAILLVGLVGELEDAATRCTALQWSISTLLEKVHHPDLAEEIHMLQDIDRMQQTLADIAGVLRVASEMPDTVTLPRDSVGAAIRMESFRARMGLTQGKELPGTESTARSDDTDISWL